MISLAMRKLNPKTIIKLTRFFYSKIIPHLPKFSNRGRPKIYPDHQIISMLLIKEVFSLSEKLLSSQETTSKKFHSSEIFITGQES